MHNFLADLERMEASEPDRANAVRAMAFCLGAMDMLYQRHLTDRLFYKLPPIGVADWDQLHASGYRPRREEIAVCLEVMGYDPRAVLVDAVANFDAVLARVEAVRGENSLN